MSFAVALYLADVDCWQSRAAFDGDISGSAREAVTLSVSRYLVLPAAACETFSSLSAGLMEHVAFGFE